MCVSVPVCAFENYLHFLHANKFARYINEIIQKLFWRPPFPLLFCLLPVVRDVVVVHSVVVVIKISKQSGNNSHTFAPAATQLILLNIHEQNEARSR